MLVTFSVFITLCSAQNKSLICNEIEGKNKDYKFRILDHEYDDGATVLICKSSLDDGLPIEIVKSTPSAPNITELNWIKGADADPNNTKIGITKFDFFDADLKNLVEVKIEGVKKSLKIKHLRIIDDFELDDNTIAYDNNEIRKYPFYAKGEDKYGLQFLEIEKKYELYGSTSPKHPSASNNILFSSSNDGVTIDNIKLHKNISKTVTGVELGVHDVKACNDISYKALVANPIYKAVEVYILNESDDDKPNWCQNSSIPDNRKLKLDCMTAIDPAHKCFLVGDDGSYDLLYNLEDIMHKDDKLNSARNAIIAGDDRCDGNPLASNIHSTTGFNESQFMAAASSTVSFYEKYGVYLNFIWKGDLPFNYDLKDDDKVLSQSEQRAIVYNSPYFDQSISKILLVPAILDQRDIYNPTLLGLGWYSEILKSGDNSCFIIPAGVSSMAISHELGHSMFGMVHPEIFSITDSKSMMKEEYNPSTDRVNEHKIRFHDLVHRIHK